ncbi:hypothetical protein TrRE_jg8639 [Triparma retinervis]|uniref:RelA/SpoT domain-containing protein n=1 Tax=Triparma retinervis TaxID=2557542 RepID=A0A9W7CCG6_9STRA|nr:hypothetical protein TrRE_jg8639 [Triparma retinervis]
MILILLMLSAAAAFVTKPSSYPDYSLRGRVAVKYRTEGEHWETILPKRGLGKEFNKLINTQTQVEAPPRLVDVGDTTGGASTMLLTSMGFLPYSLETGPTSSSVASTELFFSPTDKDVTTSLTSLESQMSQYLCPASTSRVVDAIRKASKWSLLSTSSHDTKRVAVGCTEFLQILALSEMNADTLVGAAFHYASSVDTLLTNSKNLRLQKSADRVNPEALENEFLQHLAGTDIEQFGTEPASIAVSAARLRRVECIASSIDQPSQYDSRRSLLLATTTDWRALAIRVSGSLYRLRLLERVHEKYPTVARRKEYVKEAREAMHLFSPLAKRLGMHRIKTELDEAAFRAVYPIQSRMVKEMLTEGDLGKDLSQVLDEVQKGVKKTLFEDDVFMSEIDSVTVHARKKEPFSLWRKMIKLSNGDAGPSLSDVPDAVAMRIIVKARKKTENEDDSVTRARETALCYYAQEKVLQKYPKFSDDPERTKDYIVGPKDNGYQSLHTTHKTRWHGKEWPFEVQVRSEDMHKVAEYGIAAHWAYKVGGGDVVGEGVGPMGAFLRGVREYDEKSVARAVRRKCPTVPSAG